MDFNVFYKQNLHVYGIEPSEWVRRILQLIPPPAEVLDLGIGQGRNALFLAKSGYSVTGVDNSEVAIRQCSEDSKRNGVRMNLRCEDMYEYVFPQQFNVILSTASLQYIGYDNKILEVISRMKEHTLVNGLNIISGPTRTKIAMDMPYYFDMQAVQKHYQGWDILSCEETEDMFSTGEIGTIFSLIAQKQYR